MSKRSDKRTLTFQVELQCGCTKVFPSPPPTKDDIVLCRYHNRYETVRLVLDEWRTSCVDCTYGKPFGQARVNAEIGAAKHRQKKPGHRVEIRHGGEVVMTMGENDRAMQLTIDSAEQPPF